MTKEQEKEFLDKFGCTPEMLLTSESAIVCSLHDEGEHLSSTICSTGVRKGVSVMIGTYLVDNFDLLPQIFKVMNDVKEDKQGIELVYKQEK